MWLFAWLAFAIAASIVAGNKGRSGAAWLLFGLLLGPFALLFAVISGPVRAEVEAQAVASGDSKKCPFCAELIKSEAIVCKHCGRDLPKAESAE